MNDETLLHRQVNPSWILLGRVTSQAFKPTPKDEHKLSVYDGDQIDAEDSWVHYTTSLGLASVGVLAISVAECTAEGLNARPDPDPFDEHAVIEFEGNSNSQIEKKSKKLKKKAVDRGWQYEPETE